MEKYKGKVKKYYEDKHFGFITGEDGRDVFVHFSHINAEGYKKLSDGEIVEYEVVNGQRGLEAREVKVLNKAKPAVNIERNQAIEHDTEDRGYWHKKGVKIESEFVNRIVPKLGRNIIMHPEKTNEDTFIDLLDVDLGLVADLKTQNTPFFTIAKKGYDPQFAVTFNKKDYVYYSRRYPTALVFFWVEWLQLEGYGVTVEPMNGVWEVPFSFIKEKIEKGESVLHEYKNRIGDTVNATESYLFDIRDFKKII